MPPELNRDAAARMAALAKLELSDTELDRLALELRAILGYFDEIARVDTSGIDAAVTRSSAAPLRSDDPAPSLSSADVFANAPDADRAAGLFRVPRVLGS